MQTLIVARHAETEWNVRRALNGDASVDVPLTPRGREQAVALGRSAGPVDLVAHTSFGRTRLTAELAWPEAPTLVAPEFDEIGFGRWESTAWTDGYHDWARTSSPHETCPGGGESRVEAVARYLRGYRLLLEREESMVALVAHGAQVAYLVLALQGMPPAAILPGVPPAVALVLDRARVEEALAVIDAWAREPAWS